jgi:pilus assembly protein Flp/PilA
MRIARSFLFDVSGATAIEYGLIAALLCMSIVTATQVVGTDVGGLFDKVFAELAAAFAG